MSMLQRCVSRPPVQPKIAIFGDQLTAAWGLQASDLARISAFRAEAGLLHEPAPGFWSSVARSIGHSIGLPDEAKLGTNLLVL